jgi:hypothetical protein
VCAIDERKMPRLEFEIGAWRDLVRHCSEIFGRAEGEPRFAQEPAARAEHAEVAGEDIAAGHEIDGLECGAGDDRRERGAAHHVLAGIGGHRYDEANAEAPRRHRPYRPTDPRPTHTRPAQRLKG